MIWKVGQSNNLGVEQEAFGEKLGHKGQKGSDPNYPFDKTHIAFVVDIKPNTGFGPLEIGFTLGWSLESHPFRVYMRCSCGLEWNFPVEEADVSGD